MLKNIGYSEFIKLFRIEDPMEIVPGLVLKHDGVWVEPPPDDIYLTPEERAVLTDHPEKDLTKPVLTFPCSYKQLEDFFDFYGLIFV